MAATAAGTCTTAISTMMQDRHGWMFDRALSALLDDLHDRGLLETDADRRRGRVRAHAEDQRPRGPRPLEHLCYSALLAGGGVHGGPVIGTSDRRGEHPVDRPVTRPTWGPRSSRGSASGPPT